MTSQNLRLLTALTATVLTMASEPARAEVVYDNSTTDANTRLNVPDLLEVGDEIILGGSARLASTFTFEYYAENLAGGELGIARFYANDGALVSGYASPGTVLWTSDIFAIGNTTRSTLTFDLSGENLTLPESFTWTVQFSLGFTDGTEQAGLDIYTPPSVGNSYSDYWEKVGSSWQLKTNGVVNMDFAAVVVAVPEPSVMAMIGVGAVGLLLGIRRFKS